MAAANSVGIFPGAAQPFDYLFVQIVKRIKFEMVHVMTGGWIDNFFPARRGVAAGQRDRQHQRGNLTAQVLARHPGPGKGFFPAKGDLALGHLAGCLSKRVDEAV